MLRARARGLGELVAVCHVLLHRSSEEDSTLAVPQTRAVYAPAISTSFSWQNNFLFSDTSSFENITYY
ncbi:unnamed protein product [Protopolystoma xenopodis]|uniref:Uncharacterized protein n=1 Tax=Protopolystoma xenopodis TaxID=117903 RepID=A0A3S5FGR9_9PLAT|nr:unnamed protein product [Protopolystoma xenopodis]